MVSLGVRLEMVSLGFRLEMVLKIIVDIYTGSYLALYESYCSLVDQTEIHKKRCDGMSLD